MGSKSKRVVATTVATLFVLAATATPATAQDALGQGDALDANLNASSGPRNVASPASPCGLPRPFQCPSRLRMPIATASGKRSRRAMSASRCADSPSRFAIRRKASLASRSRSEATKC